MYVPVSGWSNQSTLGSKARSLIAVTWHIAKAYLFYCLLKLTREKGTSSRYHGKNTWLLIKSVLRGFFIHKLYLPFFQLWNCQFPTCNLFLHTLWVVRFAMMLEHIERRKAVILSNHSFRSSARDSFYCSIHLAVHYYVYTLAIIFIV